MNRSLKRSKTVLTVDGHYVPLYSQPMGIDPGTGSAAAQDIDTIAAAADRSMGETHTLTN